MKKRSKILHSIKGRKGVLHVMKSKPILLIIYLIMIVLVGSQGSGYGLLKSLLPCGNYGGVARKMIIIRYIN